MFVFLSLSLSLFLSRALKWVSVLTELSDDDYSHLSSACNDNDFEGQIKIGTKHNSNKFIAKASCVLAGWRADWMIEW